MSMMLLPPRPGVCQTCARDHEPDAPHDAQSLYYQYSFRAKHGRWGTWRDALAHCPPEVREAWEAELRKIGAWSGWEGDVPPAPDVFPTPGEVGTTTLVPIEDGAEAKTKRKRRPRRKT